MLHLADRLGLDGLVDGVGRVVGGLHSYQAAAVHHGRLVPHVSTVVRPVVLGDSLRQPRLLLQDVRAERLVHFLVLQVFHGCLDGEGKERIIIVQLLLKVVTVGEESLLKVLVCLVEPVLQGNVVLNEGAE